MASPRDHDPVHSPSHYTSGAIECIDAIESALGPEGFIAFLRGQVIRYNWRLGKKDAPVQEAGKAKWYMDLLAKRLEEVAEHEKYMADRSQPIQGEALTDEKGIKDGTVIGNHLLGSREYLSDVYGEKNVFYSYSHKSFAVFTNSGLPAQP